MADVASLIILGRILFKDFQEQKTTTTVPIDPGLQPPPKSMTEYPPMTETGVMSFNDWQVAYGYGSYLDYQDWLAGN